MHICCSTLNFHAAHTCWIETTFPYTRSSFPLLFHGVSESPLPRPWISIPIPFCKFYLSHETELADSISVNTTWDKTCGFHFRIHADSISVCLRIPFSYACGFHFRKVMESKSATSEKIKKTHLIVMLKAHLNKDQEYQAYKGILKS